MPGFPDKKKLAKDFESNAECSRKILPKVENLSPAGNQSKDEQIEQLMGVVQTLTEQLAQEKARNEQPVAMPREVAPQTLLPSIPFNALPVSTRASDTQTVQVARMMLASQYMGVILMPQFFIPGTLGSISSNLFGMILSIICI